MVGPIKRKINNFQLWTVLLMNHQRLFLRLKIFCYNWNRNIQWAVIFLIEKRLLLNSWEIIGVQNQLYIIFGKALISYTILKLEIKLPHTLIFQLLIFCYTPKSLEIGQKKVYVYQ